MGSQSPKSSSPVSRTLNLFLVMVTRTEGEKGPTPPSKFPFYADYNEVTFLPIVDIYEDNWQF